MKKVIIIVLAVVAVIVGGSMLKKDKPDTQTVSPTNNIIGGGSTGVVLKEYADFQCPGCGAFYPIIKQVQDKYKDQITVQFINFPLSQIHPNALAAHRAGQAAANQGKFWEMHDLLFENQNVWKDSTNIGKDLEVYANQLTLDMLKFRTDFASAVTNSIIQADIKKGQELKITGTPTIYINDKLVEDNNSIATFEKLSEAIEKAIAEKTGQQPSSPDPTGTTEPAQTPPVQ